MDYHDEESRTSLLVVPGNEDFAIPNIDTYGSELNAVQYKQEALKPKILPNLNEKESMLLDLYKKMDLTPEQKRDFHVLLVRMASIKDLINVSKDIFNDVKEIICCADKRCLCDPSNQFRKSKTGHQNFVSRRTFGKALDDFEIEKLADLKTTNEELTRIHKQLIKLRGVIQHEDEDLNNFVNLLLLYRDVAFHKDMLLSLEEKLRRYT